MLHFGPPHPALAVQRAMNLSRIYACKEWTGRGVGAALMRACLAEAAAAGCEAVWLGVWEHNTRALAFYRKWGFAQAAITVYQFGSQAQTDLVLSRSVEDV
jgi:ribosomal protein S18 acetylase RimI-like enzyme